MTPGSLIRSNCGSPTALPLSGSKPIVYTLRLVTFTRYRREPERETPSGSNPEGAFPTRVARPAGVPSFSTIDQREDVLFESNVVKSRRRPSAIHPTSRFLPGSRMIGASRPSCSETSTISELLTPAPVGEIASAW